MRRVIIGMMSLLFVGGVCHGAAAATFKYTGKGLHRDGSAPLIPGVKKLTFTLSGPVPASGKCADEQIVQVADGVNTLSGLLAAGYVPEQGYFTATVCSDGKSNALSETVQIILDHQTAPAESVLWYSVDPVKKATADWVVYTTPNGQSMAASFKSGKLSESK